MMSRSAPLLPRLHGNPGSPCRAVAVLVLLLAAAACSRGEAAVRGASQYPVLLHGRVLTDTLELALPVGLVATDSFVVVQDAHSERAVHLIDRAGHLVGTTGRQGSGPGEFVDAETAFGRPGHPGEVWIYDVQLRRLTGYDVQTLRERPDAAPMHDPVTLDLGPTVDVPRWLDDSTLVALNAMMGPGENRFTLLGRDGRRLRTVGSPPPGSARVIPFVRQQAYGGKIAVHPSRPLFVLAGHYTGQLEIYGRDGNLRLRLATPESFTPDFHTAPDGLNMARGPHFRFGYVDVAATGNRIYALFSGHAEKDDDPYYGEFVHVFDWNGKLLKVLRLDGPALRLAVDPAARTLYALRHEPQPQLVAYDLPAPTY